MFDIRGLRCLLLPQNELESVSDRIGQLTELEVLSLKANNITEIPDGLFECKALKRLELSKNRLASDPSGRLLLHLKYLNSLDVMGNPFMGHSQL